VRGRVVPATGFEPATIGMKVRPDILSAPTVFDSPPRASRGSCGSPGLAMQIGHTSKGLERSPGAGEREMRGLSPARSVGRLPYAELEFRVHRSPRAPMVSGGDLERRFHRMQIRIVVSALFGAGNPTETSASSNSTLDQRLRMCSADCQTPTMKRAPFPTAQWCRNSPNDVAPPLLMISACARSYACVN